MAAAFFTSFQITDIAGINSINRVTIALIIAGAIILLSAVISLRKRK